MSSPYLNDSAFLKTFDKIKVKTQYVRIILLNWNEQPIREITGRATSGSVTVDSSSSMRRTAQLTLVADEKYNDITSTHNFISINKKIKLEVGFVNNTEYYKDYDILWFPMGIYVIQQASVNSSNSGVTISLTLKDKMSLLNGDCGGTIPSAVDFDVADYIDADGHLAHEYPTIYRIIQELVNHYGGEQVSKIIISDVDPQLKQTLRWYRSGTKLRLYYDGDIDGTNINWKRAEIISSNSDVDESVAGSYKDFLYGDDIGYEYVDFIYPDDLKGNTGDSVVTILDKIVETLGNYEYFYDLDGNFRFQEVKNYLNITRASIILNEMQNSDYVVDFSSGSSVYTFDDSTLVTAYSNNPQYNMVKNDFVVWGTKKVNDIEYAVRYHLAIDSKPDVGIEHTVVFVEETDETSIYQDTLIRAHHVVKVSSLPDIGVPDQYYTLDGTTVYRYSESQDQYIQVEGTVKTITTTDWRDELYMQAVEADNFALDSSYYAAELEAEWPKLYDSEAGEFYESVLNHPSDIDYFLDFIDSSEAIDELSVSNIGRRSHVETNEKVNCLFEPEIPNLVLIRDYDEADANPDSIEKRCIREGQPYIRLTKKFWIYNTSLNAITTGGTKYSAYSVVRDLLYQYTSYNEGITLTTLPIFYLEPNTRITVNDARSGISGDYIIKSMTIPLDVNGTMNISANRAIERI